MREARHGDAGFSALGTRKLAGKLPDLVLPDAGFEQRMNDAVLRRRPQPGSPVADIVRIRSRQDRRIATTARESREATVELRLAVVAPIAIVRAVLLALQLGRRDRLVLDADGISHVAGSRRARPSQAQATLP